MHPDSIHESRRLGSNNRSSSGLARFQGNFGCGQASSRLHLSVSILAQWWLKVGPRRLVEHWTGVKFVCDMPSATDVAKRALVSLLRTLAVAYGVALTLKRDAPDKEVSGAYRKVSRKTHPDRGGKTEDQTSLNNAHDAWEAAKRAAKPRGKHERIGGAPKGNAMRRRFPRICWGVSFCEVPGAAFFPGCWESLVGFGRTLPPEARGTSTPWRCVWGRRQQEAAERADGGRT